MNRLRNKQIANNIQNNSLLTMNANVSKTLIFSIYKKLCATNLALNLAIDLLK